LCFPGKIIFGVQFDGNVWVEETAGVEEEEEVVETRPMVIQLRKGSDTM
jgi:hypothetical protein